MASCNDDSGSTHLVQFGGGGLHFVQVGDFEAGDGCGFVDVGGDYVGQGNQALDQESGSGGIKQIRAGGGLENGIEHDIGQPGLSRLVWTPCRAGSKGSRRRP
jgi:hypothetical protein